MSILIAPAFLLSLAAQGWVKAAFSKYGKIANRRGISGAEAASRILEHAGLYGVKIEPAKGFLSDHYDPRTKVLRLSPDVYSRASLAAVGVAAHEAAYHYKKSPRPSRAGGICFSVLKKMSRNCRLPLSSG